VTQPMTEERITKLAFLDELYSIYAARGLDTAELSKLAGSQLDEIIKEARLLQAVRGMGQRARQAGEAVAQKVSPTRRLTAEMERSGMGDVVAKTQKQGRLSSRVEAAGREMARTPAERVKATGLKMSPEETAQITKATEQMGRGGSTGGRILGGTLEGAGQHVGHKSTLGLMTNPLGVPLGGALEGATRQSGKELVRSAGEAAQAGAGGLRGSLGRGLQQHAKRVGQAGEVAGLAALGTMAHAPLSGAGALGTAALKGVGLKGALANTLGGVGAHGVADVAGMGIQRGMGIAQRGLAAVA